jgi:hypothetical protein
MTWVELSLRDSSIAFVLLCVGVLLLMGRKKLLSEFRFLASLIAVLCVSLASSVSMLFFRSALGLSPHTAYTIYFYSHWVAFFGESILQLFLIYSVFSMAMKPLQGLHQIGKIIFRWVAAVSILVSLAIAVSPHLVGSTFDITVAMANVITQIQQGTSVLTLCLLLFVCFSTKPLGLNYRSRTFGIVLGLGILSTTILVQAAWSVITPARSLYSPVSLFGTIGLFVGVAVWGTYFALPEPERKLVLLPTTSPFFFWNRISEALGDTPGHVAISGFRPDMLAVAEMQMFTAPTLESTEFSADDYSRPSISTPLLQSATATR